MSAPRFDVAIVGFGPTGAVLAAWCGRFGLRTLVIDRAPAVYDKPRAFALDHEIQRVFQNLGVMERIAPYIAPFTPSEYYGADGQLIKRLANMAPPYPQGYTPNVVFSQPPVEAALRECAAGAGDVTVELGVEVLSVVQSAASVTLALRDPNGRQRAATARYVVGCDGASSTVRQCVDIRLDDLEFDEPWLVVDVRVNESGAAKLPKVSMQFCEPARPATYLIGVGNHRRWEIMLTPDERPSDVESDARVWQLLARWITPDDAELWRRASYRFHALVAREWRRGHVFIAGDAAHQQPPFTGQGMCQGIRDATNLAWKLARVAQGHAPDRLLDTYETERRAHVTRLTSVIKEIGKLICERDPARARARDAKLIRDAGGTIPTTTRQELIPPLEAGLVATDGASGNGRLFPQPRIAGDARNGATVLFDTRVGQDWVVVMSKDFVAGPAVSSFPARWIQMGRDGFVDADGIVEEWFARHDCSAAIVRPDRYVYGVANDVPAVHAHLGALIEFFRIEGGAS